MELKKLLLIILKISPAFMLVHRKPVAEKIWRDHCTKNSVAMNDCNWCSCDNSNRYSCKARVCREVDMFGHFNDAIREVDPGMEGHGVWRSKETACEPGVHYRKSELLCVCTEEGIWPNPVCRDIFQVLHAVEVTQYTHPEWTQACSPSKLHLIGCNVCICPSSGRINPNYCTKRQCDDEIVDEEPNDYLDTADEVYASCQPDRKYKLGCQTCTCLRNNRLLCGNCTDENNPALREHKDTDDLCDTREPNEVFFDSCNICFCDVKGRILCTAKKCNEFKRIKTKRLFPKGIPKMEFKWINETVNDADCEPGTKYKKGCNTCHCYHKGGKKILTCTVMRCPWASVLDAADCVHGTFYEEDCLDCFCFKDKIVKRKYCTPIENCGNKSKEVQSLSSMHGYCEPLHTYYKDCNRCTCMADGKTVLCTTKRCIGHKDSVEDSPFNKQVVHLVQTQDDCTPGTSFNVDCNFCFCTKNGNAACTPFSCEKP